METTCFSCQNLLSDYIEGILPSVRHDELKKHLDTCPKCGEVHQELISTLDILHEIHSSPINHDLQLRITEASAAGRSNLFSRVRFSQTVMLILVPVLVMFGLIAAFPRFFPWVSYFRNANEEALFVRYFPLLQGASEILDEQGSWLHVREPLVGSLWEEGGLSPDEFEKTFQKKNTKGNDP